MLDAEFFRRWMTVTAASVDREAERLTALDSTVGARMEAVFLADLEHAREVSLADVRARGVWERVLAWGAHMLSRVL